MKIYDLTPNQIQVVLDALHTYSANLIFKDTDGVYAHNHDKAIAKAFNLLWTLNESYWCSGWIHDPEN